MEEKRIYLMTKLAIFEESHREQLEGVRTCFRSDYIGRQMIKNGLRVTAACILMLAGWGLYHAETLVVDLNRLDIPAVAARMAFYYAVILSVFLVLTYSLQSIRYARARRDLETYHAMLDELEACYAEEARRGTVNAAGGEQRVFREYAEEARRGTVNAAGGRQRAVPEYTGEVLRSSTDVIRGERRAVREYAEEAHGGAADARSRMRRRR